MYLISILYSSTYYTYTSGSVSLKHIGLPDSRWTDLLIYRNDQRRYRMRGMKLVTSKRTHIMFAVPGSSWTEDLVQVSVSLPDNPPSDVRSQ